MDALPPPEPPEQPNQPPSKGGFKGKRSKKRAHSRTQRSGSKNQKRSSNSATPSEESTPDPAAVEVLPQARRGPSEATIYSKTSKEEYAAMYHNCRVELDAASREIAKKDLLIAKLNKQINQLTDATKSARETAREAKKHARAVEKDAEVVAKKLKAEVADAQDHLQQSSMDWEQATNAKVEEARAVEQVSLVNIVSFVEINHIAQHCHLFVLSQDRRQRAVTVIEKLMKSRIASKEREYQTLLRSKDSELKVSWFYC